MVARLRFVAVFALVAAVVTACGGKFNRVSTPHRSATSAPSTTTVPATTAPPTMAPTTTPSTTAPPRTAPPTTAAPISYSVQPCLLTGGYGPGSPYPPTKPIPKTVTQLPAGVQPPAGSSIYGTGLPYIDATVSPPGPGIVFSLAPAGSNCSPLAGSDGGEAIGFQRASGPNTPDTIDYDFSPGGAAMGGALDCSYLPVPDLYGNGPCAGARGSGPDKPGTVVAAGAGWLATVVTVPAGTVDQNFNSSPVPYPTVAIVFGSTDGNGAQDASCALPSNQMDICRATLELFAAESFAAQHDPSIMSAVKADIAKVTSAA